MQQQRASSARNRPGPRAKQQERHTYVAKEAFSGAILSDRGLVGSDAATPLSGDVSGVFLSSIGGVCSVAGDLSSTGGLLGASTEELSDSILALQGSVRYGRVFKRSVAGRAVFKEPEARLVVWVWRLKSNMCVGGRVGGCARRRRAESESKEGRAWLDGDEGETAGAGGGQPGFELKKESGTEEERKCGRAIDDREERGCCVCVGRLCASKRIAAPGGVVGGLLLVLRGVAGN